MRFNLSPSPLSISNVLLCRFGPYFVEPVIVGLDPKTDKPFVASMDLIGCPMLVDDFVVSGTCSEQMYGMCESLYKPDMVSDNIQSDKPMHGYRACYIYVELLGVLVARRCCWFMNLSLIAFGTTSM